MHISRCVFWNVNKKHCSVGLGPQTAAEDSVRMKSTTSICLIGQQACVMSRNHAFKISTTAPWLKYKTHSEEAGGGIAELQHHVEGSAQQAVEPLSRWCTGRLWQALTRQQPARSSGQCLLSQHCARQPKAVLVSETPALWAGFWASYPSPALCACG